VGDLQNKTKCALSFLCSDSFYNRGNLIPFITIRIQSVFLIGKRTNYSDNAEASRLLYFEIVF
jgi:hypothetical protein